MRFSGRICVLFLTAGLSVAAVGRDDGSLSVWTENGKVHVRTEYFEVAHPLVGHGGIPQGVKFAGSAVTDGRLTLSDRVYNRETKGRYAIISDDAATARLLMRTSDCAVIEARARYVDANGQPAPDGIHAVYRFEYRASSPIVHVTADVLRDPEGAEKWSELHFLSLSQTNRTYDSFILGDDGERVPFHKQGQTETYTVSSKWALMANARDAAGVGGGDVRYWDSAKTSQAYVRLLCGLDRMEANEMTRHLEGLLYFGPSNKPAGWYERLFSVGRGPKLETPRVRLDFAGAADGFVCRRLVDRRTGERFVYSRRADGGLWRLDFRAGPNGKAVSLDGRDAPLGRWEKTGRGLRFNWKNLSLDGEVGAVDVVCDVTRTVDEDGFEFRIKVTNRSKVYGLYKTAYPRLGSVFREGEGDAAVPGGNWGMRLWRANRKGMSGTYPSAQMPMQFASFRKGNASLYFAAHDGGASVKTFLLRSGQQVSFETLATDAGVAGTAGSPTFPFVVATMPGDWWQASMRYRKWALRQGWARKGPIAKRKDYPRRLVDNGFWFTLGGEPETVERHVDRALALVKGRVPFGVHWYLWHQIPFDNSYPEYFPAKKGFVETVARLKEKGVLVMPYINGRLWDRDIPSFVAACPFATKDENREVRVEHYGKNSRNLVPMCAAEPYWGRKLDEICSQLIATCGVNGIYVDQIGAAPPAPCFDASHHHPLGGGTHWVDGYRSLLGKIKAKASAEGVVLTTEDTAEPYMDNIDAYLTVLVDAETDIPARAAVYSDYATLFGSAMEFGNDLIAFRACMLRDTLWGNQIGRFNQWLLEPKSRDQLEFVVNIVTKRLSRKEFFAEGRLLGEVTNEAENPPVEMTWKIRKTCRSVTLPSVMAVVWQDQAGRKLLATANLSGGVREFRATLAPDWKPFFTLAPGEFRLDDEPQAHCRWIEEK